MAMHGSDRGDQGGFWAVGARGRARGVARRLLADALAVAALAAVLVLLWWFGGLS